MVEQTKLSKLKPLLFGRITRVVFGLAFLIAAVAMSTDQIGIAGFLVLLFLGLSFLVAGLIGNPGCELSALPNLLLPLSKRFHFL